MNVWMNEWANESIKWMNDWINLLKIRSRMIDEPMNEKMMGWWMNGRMNKSTIYGINKPMNERMNERMIEWTN